MATLVGNEKWSDMGTITQVFQATHNEEGKRLPHYSRSFISFSYGGKNIEDFGFIATIQNNRIQRSSYAQFKDLTSTYDMVDGQFYWGSHYVANNLDFNLSTDEITEQQLEEFKQWFTPGHIRELVLAEHPNRAIWARISAQPIYSLLPFEKIVTVNINGIEYEISTTVYRGEMTLAFIMDEPFWHARNNIIYNWYTDEEDKFGSITNESTTTAKDTLEDKDLIKVMYEDNIPHVSMITDNNILLGDSSQQLSILSPSTSGYLYYCGNAPARPIITFTLVPKIKDNYIVLPYNSFNNKEYNIFKIGDKELKFTLPSLYYGYNQAIKIVNSFKIGDSVVELQEQLRDQIKEYYSRAWAMYAINNIIKNNSGVNTEGGLIEGFKTNFISIMRQFIINEESHSIFPATFTFNSKTGEAIGKFIIHVADAQKNNAANEQGYNVYIAEIEENVGDMICSDYLIIDTRNTLLNGKIQIDNCTKISTDYENGLNNVQIIYQNMYL